MATTTTTTLATTPKFPRRTLASLKLSTKVPALLTQAQNIVQAMTNNPSSPPPRPPWRP